MNIPYSRDISIQAQTTQPSFPLSKFANKVSHSLPIYIYLEVNSETRMETLVQKGAYVVLSVVLGIRALIFSCMWFMMPGCMQYLQRGWCFLTTMLHFLIRIKCNVILQFQSLVSTRLKREFNYYRNYENIYTFVESWCVGKMCNVNENVLEIYV